MGSKQVIREIMREQRLTYAELGERIGITPQGVAEIVAGRTTSATARYSVASALGKTVEELWPEEPEHDQAA